MNREEINKKIDQRLADKEMLEIFPNWNTPVGRKLLEIDMICDDSFPRGDNPYMEFVVAMDYKIDKNDYKRLVNFFNDRDFICVDENGIINVKDSNEELLAEMMNELEEILNKK